MEAARTNVGCPYQIQSALSSLAATELVSVLKLTLFAFFAFGALVDLSSERTVGMHTMLQ
jgi:hypothetical protein